MKNNFPIKLDLRIKGAENYPSGFSMTELLVALSLAGMAISVAGSIVIAQLKENIAQESKRQLIDDWGRVGDFVNEELFASERAYPIDGENISAEDIISKASQDKNSGTCGFQPNEIRLSLVKHDASTYITYAVTPINGNESSIWRGPYLLKRCGPSLTKESIEGGNISSVLVGNLPTQTSFFARRGLNALGGALAARDVTIQLTLREGSASHTGTIGGQARVSPSYNLYSDEISTGSSCGLPTAQTALLCGSGKLEFNDNNCPGYTGAAITRESVSDPNKNCGLSKVHQFKPTGSANIIGSTESSIEDAIYFSMNHSDYIITVPCDRKSCTVTSTEGSISITDGNVLIFRDREMRL